MKAVGYCATREIYDQIYAAINSLLLNNPYIDMVYIIAEDNEIPFLRDKRIVVININTIKNSFVRGPNLKSHFTYMSFIRLLFPDLFPFLNKILYLDVDTIVDKDISELWNLDLSNYYVAAVEDVASPRLGMKYFNAGVQMMNLEKLRDGTAQKAINLILEEKFQYPDQDALNLACNGNVYWLGDEYNSGLACERVDNPKIVHFAGTLQKWRLKDYNTYFYKYNEEF